MTSLEVKLEEASLSAKVMVAEPPEVSPDALVETAMVGAVVSATTVLTDMVTELFASEPSELALPAASVKTPLATLTTPLVVLLAAGVKVAV